MSDGPASVTDALRQRRSVRAFRSDPVPPPVLTAIVEAALLSPSGGNLQPWHLHVVTEASLKRVKNRIRIAMARAEPEQPAHDIYPASLWEPYRTRRFANGEQLYAAIGIERDNKHGRMTQLARNAEFFGAPAAILLATDRRLGSAQCVDLGIVMQSLMLAAIDHGLASCAQAYWALWPETLRDELHLGDEWVVLAGLSIGYEDRNAAINQWRSARQSLGEGASFHS